MTVPLFSGTLPDRLTQDRAEFNYNVTAILGFVGGTEDTGYSASLNALAGDVNTAAAEAAASAILALSAANVTVWSNSVTYNLPDTVISPLGKAFRCIGSGVLADDPDTSSSGNWLQIDNLGEVENEIINGTFDIWHYATSGTANGFYANRIYHDSVTSTHSVSRLEFAAGGIASIPDKSVRYALVHNVTSAGGTSNCVSRIRTRLPDVRRYAGKRVYMEAHVLCAGGNHNVAFYVNQNFGSGGSTTVSTTWNIQAFQTGVWRTIRVYFDLANITGKTIGTDDFTEFNIMFEAGTSFASGALAGQTGAFTVSEWKVYVADEQRPVRRMLKEQTLHECSFYYWKQPGAFSLIGTSSAPNCYISEHIQWQRRMRKAPTVTVVGTPVYVQGQIFTIDQVGFDSCRAYFFSTVASNANSVTLDGAAAYLTADAEI